MVKQSNGEKLDRILEKLTALEIDVAVIQERINHIIACQQNDAETSKDLDKRLRKVENVIERYGVWIVLMASIIAAALTKVSDQVLSLILK